ncbi:MAG: 30S ribosomal protein S21 [Calditrichaeota bacterium]|nr:MAG: 30S ribosomal protein S21 [Calditrichota bacterium]
MIVVNIKKGESIDRALKRFKQQCQRAGIHKDLKKSSYYLKPSEKKKIARSLARRRYRKLLANNR